MDRRVGTPDVSGADVVSANIRAHKVHGSPPRSSLRSNPRRQMRIIVGFWGEDAVPRRQDARSRQATNRAAGEAGLLPLWSRAATSCGPHSLPSCEWISSSPEAFSLLPDSDRHTHTHTHRLPPPPPLLLRLTSASVNPLSCVLSLASADASLDPQINPSRDKQLKTQAAARLAPHLLSPPLV